MIRAATFYLLAVALIGSIHPATSEAHSTGGGQYVARINEVSVGSDLLDIGVVDQDAGLEITSRFDEEVVLIHPDGRPFARIGPNASFRRSFADDGDGAVKWDKITEGPSLKVGYPPMGRVPKAFNEASADETTVIDRWSIPLRVGDRTGWIRGDLRFEPSDSRAAVIELWATSGIVLVMVLLFAVDARRRRRQGAMPDAV